MTTYGDLEDEPLAIVFRLEGIKNRWKLVCIKFDCKEVRKSYWSFAEARD